MNDNVRQMLLAEIERLRTPEDHTRVAAIQAEREAYKKLSNDEKKERKEMEVFQVFEAVAGLGIDAGSPRNAKRPEPDIWCRVGGKGYYFELGEITDERLSKGVAKALKEDKIGGGSFSQTEPFEYILNTKAKKTYDTKGTPVDLILHYQTQAPPWQEYFEHMVQNSTNAIAALFTQEGGPFTRLWVLDVWGKGILLHLAPE